VALASATWYYPADDPTVDIAYLPHSGWEGGIGSGGGNFGGPRTYSRWGHGRFGRSVHQAEDDSNKEQNQHGIGASSSSSKQENKNGRRF